MSAKQLNLLNSFPKTARDIESRKLNKDINRELALRFGYEYFDGTREQGYGGYYYDGRWENVVKDIMSYYNLDNNSKILDIGCAKGFLIYDFKELFPQTEVWGVDISKYAIDRVDKSISNNVVIANAKELPFESNYFDLVVSINSLHNILNVNETIDALSEIQRVTKKYSFVSLGAYENNQERKIIDEWAVVATTYVNEKDWLKIFNKAGYEGDYWWFKPS